MGREMGRDCCLWTLVSGKLINPMSGNDSPSANVSLMQHTTELIAVFLLCPADVEGMLIVHFFGIPVHAFGICVYVVKPRRHRMRQLNTTLSPCRAFPYPACSNWFILSVLWPYSWRLQSMSLPHRNRHPSGHLPRAQLSSGVNTLAHLAQGYC